jgi:hypothetical protein
VGARDFEGKKSLAAGIAARHPVTSEPSRLPTPPDRRLGVAVLVAGLIGAAALPVAGVGIGWLAGALAVLGVVVIARSQSAGSESRRGDRAWRLAAGLAALLLVTMAGVRAAGWLVALCLVAGALLASYALTGGRSALELARGGLALIPAMVRAMGWAADGTPDGPDGQRWLGRVAAGLATGIALLLLFGALFRAADPAFAELIGRWRGAISVWTLVRAGIGFTAVAGCALGAAFLIRERRKPGLPALGGATRSRLGLAEWVIPLAMLDALFGVFVWVQVTVLFADDDYILRPGGPDYAVYARDGSVQLGVVAVLTLGVIAGVGQWVRPDSQLRRGFLRTLGGILCGLTLVVVASGLTRLWLYADAYGFTLPRLLVYAGEVWLGLIFVLLLLAGVLLRAPWFPRAATAAAVSVLLALAAVNPEAQMARTHIDRLTQDYPLDLIFLADLSADAVDAIDGLPEPNRSCLLANLAAELAEADPWYRWNAARAHARDVLSKRPFDQTYDESCTWLSRRPPQAHDAAAVVTALSADGD